MRILSIIAQKPYSTGSGVYATELMRCFDSDDSNSQALVCGIDADEPYFEEYVKQFKNVQLYPVKFNTQTLPFDIVGMSDVMPYSSTRYRNLTNQQAEQFEQEFVSKIQNVLEEFEPDIIICHHLYFLTSIVVKHFFKKYGEKIVAISHGTCIRQLSTNDFKRDEIINNVKKIKKIFALQKEQQKDIMQIFGKSENEVRIIGNGYNPQIFYFDNSAKKQEQDCINLIYAGKISKAKGVISLIKATNLVDENITLYLAGGKGDEKEFFEIEDIAKKSKHKIIFLGNLTQKELAKCYLKSDLFVFASYYEGLGLATIEAMACGLPAVVSDTAGLKDWIMQKVPNAPIEFVKLPNMKDSDKPIDEELPDYEQRFAKAVKKQIEKLKADNFEKHEPDMQKLSWSEVITNLTK